MKNMKKGQFISGGNWTTINAIMRPKDSQIFKVGDRVLWEDPDSEINLDTDMGQIFKGYIDTIMIIDNGRDSFSIEVCLTNTDPYEVGRLDLNDIEILTPKLNRLMEIKE